MPTWHSVVQEGHDLFNESSNVEHLHVRYSFVPKSLSPFLMTSLKQIPSCAVVGDEGRSLLMKMF